MYDTVSHLSLSSSAVIGVTATNSTSSRHSALWVRPKPVYRCEFSGRLCDWKNDLDNWGSQWAIAEVPGSATNSIVNKRNQAACLSRIAAADRIPSDSRDSDNEEGDPTDSPWLMDLAAHSRQSPAGSQRVASKSFQARLWSASIPALLGLRCQTFVYRIDIGQPASVSHNNRPSDPRPRKPNTSIKSGSLAGLSLLKRQEG
ncbi:unnamed protein product [Protopolystoma xenopodis]|uniref:MAM domain-containing protein n=1 Tax=Protopolystoma xenopodis TaxID=117903 RepID=A0A3S5FGT6_9PLAT|nr:unnamed protein product [Protopolystoma xenopodis]